MAKKIQIWLRLDQAECALSALNFAAMACDVVANDSVVHHPERKFVGTLARGRIDEISAVVNEAVARAQS